jgi:diguanylate cyclase (GGDEF)-like protein
MATVDRLQTLTDPLTGLGNRQLLLERTTAALERRGDRHVALLFLDLDRFKLVNDSLGHEAGDRLLVAIAERLRHCVRPADTVVRFGGDEFAVLCEDLQDPREVDGLVARLTAAVAEPVVVDGAELFPVGSIGVALANGHDDSAARLLREADAAMYRAKEAGGGAARFDEEMRRGALRRLALEAELQRALRDGELETYYQPVHRLDAGRALVAVEALVRWNHPDRGLLAPAEFIPVAEETGLIRRVGAVVLEQACAQLARWTAAGGPAATLELAVNVSPRQLSDPDIIDLVQRTLTAHGIAPARLCLEITESALVGPEVDARVRALKELGVRIAVDDFGTGWSSLANLGRLPVDVLKIDRSFVGQMDSDPQARRIVVAVLGLARSMGLATVAEGVERPAQSRALAELGCELAQGFGFCRPVSAADIDGVLAAREGIGRDALRVFVCDDAPDLRALVRAALEWEDGVVVVGEADTGAGLSDAVRDASADVVLIDLAMPGVDGLEAIPALRAALPGLGIVVLSGFARARMESEALALGADRYLEKAAGLAAMRAAVREVGGARRAA